MHIVYVCREYIPSARAGGIASYIYEIAHALVEKGVQVSIVTASDDTRKESVSEEDGIMVYRLKGGDFSIPQIEGASKLKKLRCVTRFKSYRKRIRKTIELINLETPVDLIEVADYGAEGLYLMDLNIPVVVRTHTPSVLDIRSLHTRKVPRYMLHRSLVPNGELKIYANAKYLSSCSQSLLDWIHTNVMTNPRMERVILNPVNVECNDSETKRNANGERREIKIFSAGTIVDTKGVGDLVKACAFLNEKGKKIKLQLAGKGGIYAENLKQEAKDKNWEWLEFLGHLKRNELQQYYRESDICCFPSWWENMPMVCLEALSNGAIVIGSTSGGMKEIITDGENGFLVDRKSFGQIIEKVKQICDLSKEEKECIRRNAVKTIRNRFSREKIAEETIAYYNEVIEDFKK